MLVQAITVGLLMLMAGVGATGQGQTRLGKVENAYPSFTADGARVLFQSNRNGNWDLFTMKLDGTGLVQLTSERTDEVTPVMSRDGRRIVFADNRDGNEEIYVIDADGRNPRNISRNPAGDSHPSWSPDGRRIIFCSTRGDGENDDIYSMNSDGSDVRRLTDNGLFWDTFPSWSPDGSRIVFRRLLRVRLPEGTAINSEVFVMNSDGSNAANLTKQGHFDGWPAWSPDGKRIAFATNRDDVYQVYVMNADGSNQTRLVESYYTDMRPQWSPDGRKIVFNREYQGSSEILVVDVAAAR